jgi:hypothetical protein
VHHEVLNPKMTLQHVYSKQWLQAMVRPQEYSLVQYRLYPGVQIGSNCSSPNNVEETNTSTNDKCTQASYKLHLPNSFTELVSRSELPALTLPFLGRRPNSHQPPCMQGPPSGDLKTDTLLKHLVSVARKACLGQSLGSEKLCSREDLL